MPHFYQGLPVNLELDRPGRMEEKEIVASEVKKVQEVRSENRVLQGDAAPNNAFFEVEDRFQLSLMNPTNVIDGSDTILRRSSERTILTKTKSKIILIAN